MIIEIGQTYRTRRGDLVLIEGEYSPGHLMPRILECPTHKSCVGQAGWSYKSNGNWYLKSYAEKAHYLDLVENVEPDYGIES